MNSKSLVPFFGVIVGIFIALFVVLGALSDSSSIAYVIKYLALFAALVAFVKPKWGLFIVTFEAFSVDFMKKVAVYYGSSSMMTVIDVMSTVVIGLLATYAGRVVEIAFRRGNKTCFSEWFFYLAGALVSAVVFFLAGKTGGGIASRGLDAFNTGVYIGVVGLMIGLLNDWKDLKKLMNFQILMVTIWAVVGLKQVYFGFWDLEWYYAKTGLSQVASEHMLASLDKGEDPRPFGLGSGAVNFNVIAGYAMFCILYATRKTASGKTYLWIISLLLISVMLASRLKTGSILILASPFVFLMFKRWWSTVLFYVMTFSFIVALFIYAEDLHHNISAISSPVEKLLGKEYSIQTFSPRLLGYSEFINPKNWSLFGVGGEVRGHDVLISTLIKYGGVAVFGAIFMTSVLLWKIHHLVLSIPHGKERDFATCLLVYVILGGVSGPLTGNFFSTQPLSYVLWTFVGGIYFLFVATRRGRVSADEQVVIEPTAGNLDERKPHPFGGAPTKA